MRSFFLYRDRNAYNAKGVLPAPSKVSLSVGLSFLLVCENNVSIDNNNFTLNFLPSSLFGVGFFTEAAYQDFLKQRKSNKYGSLDLFVSEGFANEVEEWLKSFNLSDNSYKSSTLYFESPLGFLRQSVCSLDEGQFVIFRLFLS